MPFPPSAFRVGLARVAALASFATMGACSRAGADPASHAAGKAPAVTAQPAPSPAPIALPAPAAPSVAPASSPAPSRPPADLDVILITIDSLRADMPWAGYTRPIAPRLTELEKRAVGFTRAYAVSSYTSMSLGGLLGGKLPGEMKRDGYFFGTYPGSVLMFPELLQAAHVHTLSAQAHGYFRDPSFQQGFDRWAIVPDITFKATTDENVTSPRQEALAEKLLSEKECDDGRFFAWFHFMDPHDQYKPHEPEIPAWGKTVRDRYDGEVTFTDKYIGKLLDFVASRPWGARTAFIVSADHGEALGERGQYAHGFELWEHLVRVPLFFVVPGAPARHVDVARGAIDLAPTILDLFGLPPEPGFEGTSLVPEIFGAAAEPRDVILDLPATSDSQRRRAIVHGKWKLIAFGDDHPAGEARPVFFQVFDLDADPREEHPIQRGPDYAAMVAQYKDLEARVKDIAPYSCRDDCLNGAYHRKEIDAGL